MNSEDLATLVSTNVLKALELTGAGPAKTAENTMAAMYIDFIKSDILSDNSQTEKLFSSLKKNINDKIAVNQLLSAISQALENEDKADSAEVQSIRMTKYFDADEAFKPGSKFKPEENEIDSETLNVYSRINELNKSGCIMVPWDFSEASEIALQHAVYCSNHMKGSIELVHVIKKEKEIEPARLRLIEKIQESKKIFNGNINYIIKEGSIYTILGQTAKEINAKLVIMGTHGATGIQKIFGSKALKVIVESTVPFLVVQNSPVKRLERIILPVTADKLFRQKIKHAEIISSSFKNIRISICKAYENDLEKRKKIEDNIDFTIAYLRKNNSDFELINLEGSDIYDATAEYLKRCAGVMCITMTTDNINIVDFVAGPNEEKLIFNEGKIPVLCINPIKFK